MNKCIYDIQEFCFGVVFVPRGGHALSFWQVGPTPQKGTVV